jgi:PD-(D/E)XK nuclease superfamily
MNERNWIVLKPGWRQAVRSAARDTITQGEIMVRAQCPRKWFYRNALLLEKKGFPDIFLIYGSLMHRLLEEYYRGGQRGLGAASASEMAVEIVGDAVLTPAQIEDVAFVSRKVQIAFDAYCAFYKEADARMVILSVEQEIEIRFQGLSFAGKLDLLSRPNGRSDGVFIWDFKTSFRLSPLIVDSWTFRFQFLFYAWLYWRHSGKKPDGIMVQGLLKSQLRPKKKETANEYFERMQAEMAEAGKEYFYRERLPLLADSLERFERETLAPHVEAFRRMQVGGPSLEALSMAQNTNQCHVYGSVCEYLRLCKDGWAALPEFGKREKKHTELSGSGNGAEESA